MQCSILDKFLEPKEDICGKSDEICCIIKCWTNVHFLVLIIVLQLYKILTLAEAEWRVYGKSLYYIYNFSVYLILSPNKGLAKKYY